MNLIEVNPVVSILCPSINITAYNVYHFILFDVSKSWNSDFCYFALIHFVFICFTDVFLFSSELDNFFIIIPVI